MVCMPILKGLCTEMFDIKAQRIYIAKDWMLNERIPQIDHQLFAFNVLDAFAASPHGRWVEVSVLQVSHSDPKCPIANMYLVLIVWKKVYIEVQRDHCIWVASTFVSWFVWLDLFVISVRSSGGVKWLQTFELPPSHNTSSLCGNNILFEKILVAKSILFNLQAMAKLGKRILEIGFVASCVSTTKES